MIEPGLIEQLEALNVVLSLEGDDLRIRAPRGVLSPGLREKLKANKEALRELLRNHPRGQQQRLPPAPLERVPRGGELPLSFAQQRLWFLDQMEPGRGTYNVPIAYRMHGRLEVEVLARTLGEVVRRHEALRTTFASREGRPVQVVHPPPAGWELPLIDLSGQPEVERGAELRRLVSGETQAPFDLSTGPLFRTSLLRLGLEEHVLLLTMHHIVSDGWSIGVLVRELATLYAALREGRPSPLPELPLQYADFACWQRQWLSGEVLDAQLAYWKQQLAGTPTLELPTARSMHSRRPHRAGWHRFTLPASLTASLEQLGRARGATLFMTLLAAFDVLLSRYSGQSDVCVGTPIANRTRSEVEPLIGFFVNTLALRSNLSGNPTFLELLERVKQTALGAYAHQDLPFERLVESLGVEREPGRLPLFQTFFALQNAPMPALELPGLSSSSLDVELDTAKFDLALSLTQQGGELSGSFEYSAELFDASTLQRMAGHFQRLLESIVARPEQRLQELELLAPSERQVLLREWSGTRAGFPDGACLHELVEAQARRTPQALALVFGERQWTYGELEERATRLACYLQQQGVGPESVVGLCVERSFDLVLGMLGILKAGGAWLPLDAALPSERLAYMLQDSGACWLLTQGPLQACCPWPPERTLLLDTWQPSATDADCGTPRARVTPRNVAYVIYTSGSTGRPKGVQIEHRGVCNLVTHERPAFGLGPGARVLQFVNPGFDVSVQEVFTTLAAGATLCLAPLERLAPGEPLRQLLREQAITTLSVPSAVLALTEATELPALETVIVGGEACSVDIVNRWSPGRRLLNAYGPTECTVMATLAECEPDGRAPSIGRPFENLEAYVLDAWMQPVPVGVPGELYLGGVGLARGYLGRPELTAERFVPHPFSQEPGARLYRTGDRVCWRAGGELDFLGRMDTQVKLRGLRIELGEVEAVLCEHVAVREAVVVVREEGPTGKQLVAYAVPMPGHELDSEALRQHLQRRLPGYMVPSAIMSLAELPLTPNGKVDRKALPAPESHQAREGFVEPRTATERMLAGLWSELLGVERVGLHDDFFALGGHSLLATQLVSRLRSSLGIELPVRVLFEEHTVAALAARLEALRPSGSSAKAPPLERVPREGALPASFAQQRLWFLEQLAPGRDAYNMPSALRLRGSLDAEALRKAFEELVRRHEVLRTTFASHEGQPVQVIHPPPASWPLPVTDLSPWPGVAREEEVQRRTREESRGPFNLSTGPLFRTSLLHLGPEEHVLLLTMHHIVSDGWSIGVLVRELAALYEALREGRPSPLPELSLQYADFACWQRQWLSGEVLDAQLAYWKERLADVPVLELPSDRPRTPLAVHRSGWHFFTLPAELTAALERLGRARGSTLFMTLLAAFDVLLSRYAGQSDVCVGTPIANRTRAEVEPLIGFFVNTLVLRTDLSGAPTFVELLERVKETALGAYAHQELPFERLVEALGGARDLSRSPLFQVMFALQNAPTKDFTLAGLELEPLPEPPGTAHFDLTLSLVEQAGQLSGSFEYSAELFDASTLQRMAGHFQRLLESIVAHPEQRLHELELLAPSERQVLLREWSGTRAGFPDGACLHELVEAQARRTPQALALVFGERQWTYGELEERATRLACYLQQQGVGPESVVGLCVERSFDLVLGMLGILKAGGAWLPLDAALPSERLAYMLQDSGACWLLTQSALQACCPWPPERTLLLDTWQPSVTDADSGTPRARVTPRNVAYVIYTSGSTGRPKGVQIEHRGVCNLVTHERPAFGLGPGARVLQFANPGFDVSVEEVFTTLAAGATLCLAPLERLAPGEPLRQLLREQAITTLSAPPAVLALTEPAELPALETVIVGGDACSADIVNRWSPGRRLLNAYGPTECTVLATLTECEPDGRAPSIGRPFENLEAYVLDAWMQPVPVGVPGELYLGGVGLARGYLGRPELTAERFVPHPFSQEPGARLYRTGDRVCWRAGGELDFLGRMDTQVKLRGLRIELGEVEAVLCEHAGVREAVVVVREEGPAGKQLVAYAVPVPGHELDGEALRQHLQRRLPGYMVPSAIMSLAELPLTPNGKVDRKALPAPESHQAREGFVEPRTATERMLAGLWSELLGVERVGLHDDFFALGGHSLLATQLVSRLRSVLDCELPVRVLFEAPTLAALAARVEGPDAPRGAGPRSPIPKVPRDGGLALSFAQQRMWFMDQLEPGGTAYNMPEALRLRGVLDTEALQWAFAELVRRHEVLRTTFVSHEGQPVQVIHPPPASWALPVTDLSALPGAERSTQVRRLADEEARGCFALASGPLLRTGLLRLGPEEHVLLLTMHHIVSDGWSFGVLVRELAALYAAFREGRPSPLPELPLQYADFACWQRQWLAGALLEAQLQHWSRKLEGAPELLLLPTDRPRPAVASPSGAWVAFQVPPGTTSALRALAAAEGATLYMALLAAFDILLFRHTGQQDLLVGSPIANRGRRELEDLIGPFLNTLVMRTDLSGAPGYRELLARVKAVALEAYAHQDLPFEQLVEALRPARSLSHTPLFQVLLVLQNAPMPALELPGLSLSPVELDLGSAKFDLTLTLAESAGGLSGGFGYRTDLFEAATVERMAGHFVRLLESIVAEPERSLATLPMLTGPERRQLLGTFAGGHAAYPGSRCVHELFEAQVENNPQALAVADEGGALTYEALERRANRIAHFLRARGVGPESLVGLYMESCTDMIACVLGILKAGGAYVPMDPLFPADRVAFMLEDARVRVLLTKTSMRERLPESGVEWLFVDEPGALEGQPETRLAPTATPGSAVYVIYTSGSTGRPKGVVIEHRQLLNYLHAVMERTGLVPGFSFAMLQPLAVDSCKTVIYPALCHGGALHVMPRDRASDPEVVLSYFRQHRIDVLKIAPSHLSALLQAHPARELLPGRVLIVGGESSQWSWLRSVQALAPELSIFNHYGPTEATVGMLTFPFSREQASARGGGVPLGRPLPNCRAYILDSHGQPVPVGVPGELYIGGRCVARGYLNRPDLTLERFVPDPFSEEPGERLYRTGDLARLLPGGDVEFLGRTDHQVKIRGFRIELGEIQAALGRHPEVREALVLAREDGGTKRLVAYVVPKERTGGEAGPDRETLPGRLRDFLKQRLPDYMVPSAFVTLGALPLTPHGKVDLRALPAPGAQAPGTGAPDAAPRTRAEQVLAGLWCQVLRLERVGIHDNFFSLGGDSILAIQLVAAANRVGLRLSVRKLFQYQTVAELAASLSESGPAAPVDQGPVTGELPLTPIQLDFLRGTRDEPHHFNQAVLLEACVDVPPEVVRRAMDALVEHHDALRLRYRPSSEGWVQWNEGLEARAAFELFDLSGVPDAHVARAIEETGTRLQASLDLTSGPTVRAGYFTLGSGRPARVLLVIHHLAVDGVSWRILLEDLDAACALALRGEPLQLPPKTTSFRRWAERWTAHAASREVAEETAAWLTLEASAPARLPCDFPAEGEDFGLEASLRTVTLALDPETTRALLHELPAHGHARLDEALLTALLCACTDWTGTSSLLLDLEGHGRPELFEDVDLSRTVGWFTALYPLLLERPSGTGPLQALRLVKERLRSIPHGGAGFGLSRCYHPEPELRRRLGALPRPALRCNYLGQVDLTARQGGCFGPGREPVGPSSSPRHRLRYLIDVLGRVEGGRLTLEWLYSAERYRPETIEALASRCAATLRTLVAQARERGAEAFTPSDFPLARLEAPALARVLAAVPDAEDLYALTPLQREMLGHVVHEEGTGAYFLRTVYRLRGALDVEAFARACQWVVNQHPALRTSFHGEHLEDTVQVVRRRVEVPFTREDVRGLSPEAWQRRLQVFLEEERTRPFVLSTAPLLRFHVFEGAGDTHHVALTQLHLLHDGWSKALFLEQLLETYERLRRGLPPAERPVHRYRDYLAWRDRQDPAATEAFFRQALQGFTGPSRFAGQRPPAPTRKPDRHEQLLRIPQTAALQELARRHRLTLNTVMAGTFALVLRAGSGADELLFGCTVSGRSTELPGGSETVGLFMNTLPVAVRVTPGESILPFLARFQEQLAELRQHEHAALEDIRRVSEVPPRVPLFESLFVFENYPLRSLEEPARSLRIDDVRQIDWTHHPLTVFVVPGPELAVAAVYDRRCFEEGTITELLTKWHLLLQEVVA